MKTLVSYNDKVKNISTDGLKVELSGVTVLELPTDDDDEDMVLDGGKSRLAQEVGKKKDIL